MRRSERTTQGYSRLLLAASTVDIGVLPKRRGMRLVSSTDVTVSQWQYVLTAQSMKDSVDPTPICRPLLSCHVETLRPWHWKERAVSSGIRRGPLSLKWTSLQLQAYHYHK